jgi:hypothetical protein
MVYTTIIYINSNLSISRIYEWIIGTVQINDLSDLNLIRTKN